MQLTLDQTLQKGIKAHQAGEVQEAYHNYTAILKVQPKHPDANHNMGILAVDVGKVEDALPFFKTALEANPSIAQFWLSYIDSLIKLDRIEDAKIILEQAQSKEVKGMSFDKLAIKLFKDFQTNKEQSRQEILDKAIELRENGRYDEAIVFLKDNHNKLPTDPNILATLSHCYILKEDEEKAKIYLDAAKNKNPNIASVGWNETRLLLKQKKVKEALAVADKTNKLFPNDVEGMGVLGSCLRACGSYTESLKHLNKAIKLNPNYAEALINRALISLAQDDKASALTDLGKAHHLKPHIKQIWHLILNLKMEIEEYEDVISIAEAMERLDPLDEKIINALALCYQHLNNYKQAEIFYKKAIEIKSNYLEAWANLGLAFKEQGKLEEAIEAYNKAISIKPDYAEAYYNTGNALYDQGKLEEAIKAFNTALSFKPDFIEAYKNMGNALKDIGKLEGAIEACKKIISLKPADTDAYYNMGNALYDQGNLEKAIEAYKKAISIKPNYAEAHNNIGNAFKEQGKLEEAIDGYKKALYLNSGLAMAHNNMGLVLQDQGKLEEAIEACGKALSIQPDLVEVWDNIYYPLQGIKTKLSHDEAVNFYNPNCIDNNYAKIALGILQHRLHRGQKTSGSFLDQALSLLSSAENMTIQNPTFDRAPDTQMPALPKKMVALVHFGRSGTGLMHSLIDGHPEVSTLPSIYLSQYFDHSIWTKITLGGRKEMVSRFISIYEVLFNASSSVPIVSKSQQLKYNIGIEEGMTNVGDERNEILGIDKAVFRSELNRLIDYHEEMDAFVFFKLVHAAFDKSIASYKNKSLIFYHIHNPDTYAKLNFIRSAPEANWIIMVREPIQSCESWIRQNYQKYDHPKIVNQIISMLFEIDDVVYTRQRSLGVRLEDLKRKPQEAIPALCNWMGIEDVESLYQMTAQGKKWWGDPASPDYSKDGMDPFGKTSINRKVGSIFSDNDQFVLSTLFYPFSVRFGYTEENKEKFKVDLKKIRPMIDEILDFEKKIVERMQMNVEQFVSSGSYLCLRTVLIERWNTLNEFHTYPNMIKPLQI